MSYNITDFQLIRLERFQIPISAFFMGNRNDWFPEINFDKDLDSVILSVFSDAIFLKGKIKDEVFYCEDIHIVDEGSGSALKYTLIPALKRSSGILEALCIWEEGDMIERLLIRGEKAIFFRVE